MARAHLPPGLVALIRLLPHLLPPPALVYASFRIHNVVRGKPLARSLRILAYILAFPVTFAAKILYTHIRNHREAALRGAVMATPIRSSWPGALDKLVKLLWNYSNGYMCEYFASECEELGCAWNFWALYENRIVTIEPEHINSFLVKEFTSYGKGPHFNDQFKSLFGGGIFNVDGDEWKFHRTMLRPFFARDRISDFEIFERHTQDVINKIKARLREGYSVDFQDAAMRFALDLATEFLFGHGARTLSAGLVYPPSSPLSKDPSQVNNPNNKFFRSFVDAEIAVARRGWLGYAWRFTEFWRDETKKHLDICVDVIDPIVSNALIKKRKQGHLEQNTKKVAEGHTLLDHLVKCTDDQTIIRDQTVNVLAAGMETISGTLTFAIHMLSQHPEVFTRLRQEVIEKFGVSGRPTNEDLKGMAYMKAFFNEVLRLYPSIPINARASRGAQVLPAVGGKKPLYIPPNTTVAYSVFLLHRRKDLWGPDAEIFDPDRFLDERLHKYLTPNPTIYMPFNAGPRICLGQQLAYNIVSFFLVRTSQAFDSITMDEAIQKKPPADWAKAKGRKAMEKIVLRSHLNMFVEDGLWVKMKEADLVESG